jgi:integrating conjugative element protein (TIGR03752 family)
MAMSSNIVVKALAVSIVVVLVVVVIKGKDDSTESVNVAFEESPPGAGLSVIESGPAQPDNGLSIDPLGEEYLEKEYGVDVDSPVETMRTLTNETRAVREDSLLLQEENKKLKQEIGRLLEMEEALNKRVANKFTNAEERAEKKQRELEHTQGITQDLISKLEARLEQLQSTSREKGATSANGYDINSAGIPTGLGYDDHGTPVNFDEILWTQPIDADIDAKDPTKITLPSFNRNDVLPPVTTGDVLSSRSKADKTLSTPAYTIPINATLLGSISMTAMLGRIPVDGQVTDPYPFKLLVGEENLSSNGVRIPGVTGIKMSGVARGDWTLSCVSGSVMSMTFTFADGAIVTIPEPGTKANEPLAWFSDMNGIPCVTGKRITNAASYLGSRIGLTAASSYANAEAAAQFTTQTNDAGGLTSGLTGDPTVVAQNAAISKSLNEVTDWLDARQQNSFDAIYIPPGTPLAIHVTEELKIDYDPSGRKVNHYANASRRSDLHLD